MTSHDARRVLLSHIDHRYDTDPVLRDVSLDVAAGESVALLGPSGCGKTTLLRVLAGLERPEAGTVTIGDDLVTGDGVWVPPEQRRVGMVFQDWALFPHMTVGENVAYGLPRSPDRDNKVAATLGLVGLRDLADRMPTTLSGGQQQRVALARALAPEPTVLLLDEPFSNLDTSMRVEVRSEVHRLLRDLGITAVFVTHDQEEAFVLGERVAVMREGRVVQFDVPRRIYERPTDRHVAEFVGSGVLVPATVSAGIATCAIGTVPLVSDSVSPTTDGRVDLLLRPEQLTVSPGGTGKVELVEYYGHDARVLVNVDGQTLAIRSEPTTELRRGDAVTVAFTGVDASAFPAT